MTFDVAFKRLLGALYRQGARDQEYPGLEPCQYCTGGIRTGLPGNACENCMNTGFASGADKQHRSPQGE